MTHGLKKHKRRERAIDLAPGREQWPAQENGLAKLPLGWLVRGKRARAGAGGRNKSSDCSLELLCSFDTEVPRGTKDIKQQISLAAACYC